MLFERKYAVALFEGGLVNIITLDGSLEGYQKAVGGYIETVHTKLPGGEIMIMAIESRNNGALPLFRH